jgi:hypothetical protein
LGKFVYLIPIIFPEMAPQYFELFDLRHGQREFFSEDAVPRKMKIEKINGTGRKKRKPIPLSPHFIKIQTDSFCLDLFSELSPEIPVLKREDHERF